MPRIYETSFATDLLLPLRRSDRGPLRGQIESQLRQAIRSGTLRPGTRMPSTRDLASQLGISRGVVVNAYAQLGAEGYLIVRQGSRPRVSETAAGPSEAAPPPPTVETVRFDFRLGVPDVSKFPRDAWLRSVRSGISSMTTADLGYGDARGTVRLRSTLAEYLGRVRGVVASPERIVVTSGYLQGVNLVCRALAAAGARRIAFENPSDTEPRIVAGRAGLEVVPIAVDASGLRVEELASNKVDAVVVTPAHQFPTGAVLAADRRAALTEWLRRRGAIAIEGDYDAEYRYDRAPVGALQGLDPERVVYAGSTSKTLAPALRTGWLVVPHPLLEGVAREKLLADRGTARIEQFALADFIDRGELDRHLRRMRIRYRRRREALLGALAEQAPQAAIDGIAAGLHAVIRLPEDHDEKAILEECRRRRVAMSSIDEFFTGPSAGPPTLLLGYSQSAEATIRAGIAEIAVAIEVSRWSRRWVGRSASPKRGRASPARSALCAPSRAGLSRTSNLRRMGSAEGGQESGPEKNCPMKPSALTRLSGPNLVPRVRVGLVPHSSRQRPGDVKKRRGQLEHRIPRSGTRFGHRRW